MPKNLTDVSQWATVAVPVGTDTADAASVETTFQILTDRCKYLLDLAEHYSGINYCNLNEADISTITTFDINNILGGCFEPNKVGQPVHTLIDNDGETIICRKNLQQGLNGSYWIDESATPNSVLTWTAAATKAALCQDNEGSTPRRCAVSNSATGQVAYSTNYGSWAAPSGIAGIIWNCCEFGYPGSRLWAIGGNSGAISTTTSISATAFTSRTSGLSGNVLRIRSNRKTTGHAFLALDASGDVSVSNSDGTSWTATASGSLGLSSTLLDIAWDAKNNRWIGYQSNGYLAFSSDGIAWTENSSSKLPTWMQSPDIACLDADDQGHYILSGKDSANSFARIYVGGSMMGTDKFWIPATAPALVGYVDYVFVGDGKIIAGGATGILYSDQTFSTRRNA